MSKPGQSFLIYLGAFGTVWTLLRDFGLEVEAAVIVLVFAAGVLTGLRLRLLATRRPEAPAAIRSRQRRRAR
jgi:hypothetical protein